MPFPKSKTQLQRIAEQAKDTAGERVNARNIINQLPGATLPPGGPAAPGATGTGYPPADTSVTTGKIVDDAVTFAKMQNISTNKLLGRSTASTGDIEQISIGSGLSLAAGTLTASGGGGSLPWFDVTQYGAVGDGSADDTTDIASAVSDLVSAGKGVLYFPAGTYKTSGGFTLSVPCLVLGDGMAEPNAATWVSAITCTSQTATLFTLTSDGISFEGLHLLNTYAGTPTAGAALTVTTGDGLQLIACSFRGFYRDVDIQDGAEQYIERCFFYGAVKELLKIRHIDLPDAGDMGIVNCQFIAKDYDCDAAIRQESAGGLRIVGCKFNERGSNRFGYGIDVAIGSGNSTSILLVTGTSIENVDTGAIRVAATGGATFGFIGITGCQFGMYGITNSAISVSAATIGDIRHLNVIGCAFKAGSSTGNAAIDATNIDLVTIIPGTIENYADMLSESGCTNVIDMSTGGFSNPMTTAGDLIKGGSSGVAQRLGVGSEDQVLTVFAGIPAWRTPRIYSPLTNGNPASPELIFDNNGDVILA